MKSSKAGRGIISKNIQGTQRQQKIMAKVTSFFRDHGRSVITLPIEKISGTMKKTPRPQAKNLQLAF